MKYVLLDCCGKLPPNEASSHIHHLVRQWHSFFPESRNIHSMLRKIISCFSQNLSRPRVGVHGILCALRHPYHPKESCSCLELKVCFYSALMFLFFLKRLLFFRVAITTLQSFTFPIPIHFKGNTKYSPFNTQQGSFWQNSNGSVFPIKLALFFLVFHWVIPTLCTTVQKLLMPLAWLIWPLEYVQPPSSILTSSPHP